MNSTNPAGQNASARLVDCIAIGNPLRGDDGVAHRVLELLSSRDEIRTLSILQLTPEIASYLSDTKAVFFIDADVSSVRPTIEPLQLVNSANSSLSHHVSPGEVVALAQNLFGFSGRAFLCRVPATRFENGEKLSAEADQCARQAAAMLDAAIATALSSGSLSTNKP